METLRQLYIDEFVTKLADLATEYNRNVQEELSLASRALSAHAAQWRPRLSLYNWWRKDNAARHASIAIAELTLEEFAHYEALKGPQKGKYKLDCMLAIATREYQAFTDAEKEQLWSDFHANTDDSVYTNSSISMPRTPTKKKLISIPQTRKIGFKTMEHMVAKTIMFAETHDFDIAVYLSDKTLQLDGGIPYQQLGTTNGVHFITLLQQKGLNGEILQTLSQSSHKKLLPPPQARSHVLENAAPGLAPIPENIAQMPQKSSNRQQLNRTKSDYIRQAIRDLVPLSCRSKPFHNIRQDATQFERDLHERGLELVIDDGVGLTLADVINNEADVILLRKVYMALVSGVVRIQQIAA